MQFLCNDKKKIGRGYAGATPREGTGWLPGRAVPSADFSKEADGAQAAAGSASTYIHVR